MVFGSRIEKNGELGMEALIAEFDIGRTAVIRYLGFIRNNPDIGVLVQGTGAYENLESEAKVAVCEFSISTHNI